MPRWQLLPAAWMLPPAIHNMTHVDNTKQNLANF
jgi:hypothetical protein